MAVGIASGQANKALDAYTGNATFTAQTAFWVKLHTGDPGSAGTSNAATETTRKQATFGAASAGSATTTGDLAWTNVAGSETYSHVSFWTANAAGTFLGSDALDTSRAVTAGDSFTIVTGSLTITLTPLAA